MSRVNIAPAQSTSARVERSQSSTARARPRGQLVPGDRVLDKLRIESVLGEGGMAVVYGVRHELLELPLALKILHPTLAMEEAESRFFHEAKIAARIRNDHVCTVLDVGRLPEGSPYILMDLLEGTNLEDLVAKRGPLSVSEAIDLALQTLEGLAHAHAVGVVHRDLKPKNLFVSLGGTLKVLDFGVSKSMMLEGLTMSGTFIGSPTYASPEQILEPQTVDVRTDIWSMGVVLHEMLTCQVPFDGESLETVLRGILHEPAPPVARLDVPLELKTIILRCLAKAREERFANAFELAAAIAPFAAGSASDRVRRIGIAVGVLDAPRTSAPPAPSVPPRQMESGMRVRETLPIPSSPPPKPEPAFLSDVRTWRTMSIVLAMLAIMLAAVALFAVRQARRESRHVVLEQPTEPINYHEIRGKGAASFGEALRAPWGRARPPTRSPSAR